MASDGDPFEILPDLQLEDFTTPAIPSFVETRRRYERIIDDKNVFLRPSKRMSKMQMKTAIAPHGHLQASREGQTGRPHRRGPSGFPARIR
jgi:hypothetical protein